MISKEKANYTNSATTKHCQDCSMFRKGEFVNHCTLVIGSIKAKGSCSHWEKKI